MTDHINMTGCVMRSFRGMLLRRPAQIAAKRHSYKEKCLSAHCRRMRDILKSVYSSINRAAFYKIVSGEVPFITSDPSHPRFGMTVQTTGDQIGPFTPFMVRLPGFPTSQVREFMCCSCRNLYLCRLCNLPLWISQMKANASPSLTFEAASMKTQS